jgi:spore germination cell wall hydrolase CwlJ-like protein
MNKTRMRRRQRENIAYVVVILALLAATTAAFARAAKLEDNTVSEEYQMYLKNRDEEWFNLAEEDYMEDPLESEHIEQAIYELPNKRYPLTDEEFYLVCGIVMAEAEGEPYEGKMAVAQCILNNCERDNARPADVAWKFGDPEDTWTDDVWLAVTAVFNEGQTITDEQILWFYAPAYGVSEWHERQRFVMEIGGHRFFAEKE